MPGLTDLNARLGVDEIFTENVFSHDKLPHFVVTVNVAVCPLGVSLATLSSKNNDLVLPTPILPAVCVGLAIVTYGSFAKDNVTVVFSSLGPLPLFLTVTPIVLLPVEIVAGANALS